MAYLSEIRSEIDRLTESGYTPVMIKATQRTLDAIRKESEAYLISKGLEPEIESVYGLELWTTIDISEGNWRVMVSWERNL